MKQLIVIRHSQDFWQKGEFENVIEALDHTYSLILKADMEDMSLGFLQQNEDLRFTISQRILNRCTSSSTLSD